MYLNCAKLLVKEYAKHKEEVLKMRITKKQLYAKAEFINKLSGLDISVGYAYGHPRAYLNNESKELSPRLPAGQLWDWLDAFQTGIEYGVKIGVHGSTS